MKSIQRQWRLVPMLLGASLALATPAHAQRSGFIVGFGLGPGHYSLSSSGTSQGKTGVGVDFHIGGTVGTGVEIYLFEKFVVSGSDSPSIDAQGTGVAGVGVAFPVSPKFDVHGGVGTGIWAESASASSGSTSVSATATETNGLGLVAGGRYKLNEDGRWMLNFDLMHAAAPLGEGGPSALAFQVTVNIMSH